MKEVISYNILILLMFFGGACSSDFDPPGRLGDEPRIMAMVAAPPEGRQGEPVELTLHLYDPSGTYRTRWLRCIPYPGQPVERCPSDYAEFLGMTDLPPCSPDIVAPCVIQGDGTASDGAGRHVVTRLPSVSGSTDRYVIYYYALSAPADDPVAACTGFITDPPVPDPGCLVGVKRVIITDEPSNDNPRIWNILVDSVPVPDSTALAPGRYRVSPALLPASLDEMTGDESVFYPVEWFTDCGELSSYRQDMKCYRNDTGALQCDYAAPELEIPEPDNTSRDQTCRLDAVVWDNLGGVDIREVVITVTRMQGISY